MKEKKAVDMGLSDEDREEIRSYFSQNRELPKEEFKKLGGMRIERATSKGHFEGIPINHRATYVLRLAGLSYAEILEFASKAKAKRTLVSWFQKAMDKREELGAWA